MEPKALDAEVRSRVRAAIEELQAEYANFERGMEIRQIAGGFRMGTRPEHHDAVRAFAKSLKPPMKLSLQALETLAVVAYKQPITAPEITEIRGVESSGVLSTLLERKLITTAGRKQVIGRPILYKTSKEFLLRFGLKDVGELPSLEEFEKMTAEGAEDLFSQPVAQEPQLAESSVSDTEHEAPAEAQRH
jgi:segregation and condensation protein B